MEKETRLPPQFNQIQAYIRQVTDEQYRKVVIPAILIMGCILVILISVISGNRGGGDRLDEPFVTRFGRILAAQPEVIAAKAVHVPDDGIYIYTQLNMEDRTLVLTWLQRQLVANGEAFAEQDQRENLTWIFDYGASSQFREALVVPLSRAAESTYHQYLQVNALPPVLLNEPVINPNMLILSGTADAVGLVGSSGQSNGINVRPVSLLPWFETYEAQFDNRTLSDWTEVNGTWVSNNSRLIQTDLKAYDAILQLSSQPLARYRLDSDFVLLDGAFDVGIIMNAPVLGETTDADLMTITNNGTQVEVGYIDENGIFQFVSGFPITPPLDRSLAHTLRLDANAGENTLFVDGVEVASFLTRRASGHVGLVTSQGIFEFNNFRVENFEGRTFQSESAPAPVVQNEPAPVVGNVQPVPDALIESEPVGQQSQPAADIDATNPGVVQVPNVTLGGSSLVATSPTLLYTGGFDTGATGWAPLTGEWVVNNGIYEQVNLAGFDYVTMFEMDPLEHYSLEGELRMVDGENGGGFIYNAPDPNTRIGAHVVDFTDSGRFLRWGYYDENSSFVFTDGVQLDPGLSDGAFHNLRLVTHETETRVFVDGVEVGLIENQNSGGHLGLTASQARIQFDDLLITQLPPETSLLNGDFVDGFDGAFPENWRTISGDWQIIDSEFHQTDVNGFDLTTVSNFAAEDFIFSTRVRLVGGVMGAGIIYNMQSDDTIAGSHMFNFTQFGEALQWGRFNESGDFVFQGIANVDDASDGGWHELELVVQNGRSRIIYDGIILAENVPLTYESGFIGLLVSTSHVAFDDIQVTSLDGTSLQEIEEFEQVSIVSTFDDAATSEKWRSFSGSWAIDDGVYRQTEVDLFDLGSTIDYQLVGPHTLQSDLRYVSGSMGGGLFFNMQSRTSKNESHMVSYTSDGRFLQWGDFDEDGVFNVKGSRQVTDAQDGEWYTLAVQVDEDSFDILLNGEAIVEAVPLVYQNGYPGLISNLSQVEFDNFTLDGRARIVRVIEG
ncbi:MAG: family 16 glycoside hydrolase [Chloroflexota bacterium]